MFTVLTNEAKEYILTGSQGIQFTKYAVGSLPSSVRSNLSNDAPHSANAILSSFVSSFEGTHSTITYSNVDDSRSTLKMDVPSQYEYFKFNTVIVYCIVEDEEIPLFVSYSMVGETPKFSTQLNRFGLRYFHVLQLKTSNRELFDLSNLSTEYADFEFYDETDLPSAFRLNLDQVVVENHQMTPKGYGVMAVESLGQHWGILAEPTTDNTGLSLDSQGDVVLVGDNEIIVPYGSTTTNLFLLAGLL